MKSQLWYDRSSPTGLHQAGKMQMEMQGFEAPGTACMANSAADMPDCSLPGCKCLPGDSAKKQQREPENQAHFDAQTPWG